MSNEFGPPIRLEAQGQTVDQRRQNDSSQQQNSSRAMSNRIGHAPVRLEATTPESRQVRMSDTSHLTLPTGIQNSLGLANPTAGQAVPCKKSEISQQRNDGGAVSTQIGHTPVRLEAQGQTAVQCRQNESLQQQNCSGAVSSQVGYAPVRLVPRAKPQISAGRATLRSSRTVVGQCHIRSGHPFG